MNRNDHSIGCAPQVWAEPDGTVEIISRREMRADIMKAETGEKLLPPRERGGPFLWIRRLFGST